MSSLRCLGGGELVGDKLVRMIYLDEAGISNNGCENTVVVAGCIIHMDNQWKPLQERFAELVEKHVPKEHHQGFVFHAKDIWHGSRAFDRKTYTRDRRQIFVDLCQTIKDFDLAVVYGTAKKDKIAQMIEAHDATPATPKEIAETAYMAALGGAASLANAWVEHNTENELSSIVIEDTDAFRGVGKIAFRMMREHTNPELFDLVPGMPLPHIIDEPSYTAKAGAPVLQLADVCAFLLRRLFDDKNDTRDLLEIILPQIWTFPDAWAEAQS